MNERHSLVPLERALDAPSSADDGGIFSSIKADFGEAIDLFRGVDQSDIAKNPQGTTALSRADKIELLVDKSTQGLNASPWSVGLQLDASVAQQIHAGHGGTLAFGITAGFLTDFESKINTKRYALVWDDNAVSETGNLDLSAIGQAFLIVALADNPPGQVLTLWVTDNDLHTTLVQQGGKTDADAIRKKIVGDVGAAADKPSGNPLTDAFNAVTGFLTLSQVGGLVALAAVGVVLIVIVRSNAATELAKGVKVIA